MKTWMLYAVIVLVVIGVVAWTMRGREANQEPVKQTPVPAVTAPAAPVAPAAPAVSPQAARAMEAAGKTADAIDKKLGAMKVVSGGAGGAPDTSKWIEGMSAMGTIASAMRAYYVEVGPKGRIPNSLDTLGLTPEDVDGKYFGPADFTITVESMDPLTFTVTCTPGSKPGAPKTPAKRTLNSDGKWGQE